MKWQKIDAPTLSLERIGSAVDSGRLAHCVLLTGNTAEIRKKVAYNIASALLCESDKNTPCGKCSACKKVKEKVHTGIIFTEVPDGKKFIPLDLIKENIISKANTLPTDGKFNIFIVHEASDLREEAANALLKTIEEPESFSMFILTSSSRAAVLPTILSRSEEFSLGEEKESIAGATQKKVEEISLSLISALLNKSEKELMLASSPLTKNRVLTGRVCEKMKLCMRDALVYGKSECISGLDAATKNIYDNFDKCTILKIIEVLDKLLDAIEISCNENLLLCSLSSGLAAAIRKDKV